MDLYPPGSMTSTHTGNPICAVAALANLQVIEDERSPYLWRMLNEWAKSFSRPCVESGEKFSDHVGAVHGLGLVAALHMVTPGGIEPNAPLAGAIVRRCVEKGLLMFAPVG